MLVSNVNFQIIFPVWYEVTCFTTVVWTFWIYSLYDKKSPHWKHLKDTLDTRFKMSCLFMMWTSIFFLFFCIWSHRLNTGNVCKNLWILNLNSYPCFLCELSDHISSLKWSHKFHNWSGNFLIMFSFWCEVTALEPLEKYKI